MPRRYSEYERDRQGKRFAEEDDQTHEPRSRNYAESRREDRGLVDRASDEVRSWFGDEEAERRRQIDDRRRSVDESTAGDQKHFWTDLSARDLMTRDVLSVHPAETVERAARMMRECDCGAIPVVDGEDRLVGVITDRDITVRLVARGVDVRRAFVDDCMTDQAFACRTNDPIEECMREMARHQIRRLPIVDDQDRLVGILSQGDLAQHAGRNAGRGERRALAETLSAVSEPTARPH
jgi:CBS domain-containing protein